MWGYGFQFVCALLLLRWETGRAIIDWVSSRIIVFITYTYTDGSQFVFGWLWKPPEICGMGPVLAFEVQFICKCWRWFIYVKCSHRACFQSSFLSPSFPFSTITELYKQYWNGKCNTSTKNTNLTELFIKNWAKQICKRKYFRDFFSKLY